MKKNVLIFFILIILTTSCHDDYFLIEPDKIESGRSESGLYILSEGLFNQNNSSLAYLNFSNNLLETWQEENKTGVQKSSTDIFMKVNGRKLGDTANDMLLYGNKIYIAVSVSSYVEIIDASTGVSLEQVKMFNDNKPREPRKMAANNGKVYVCAYDGSVSKIDTLTMEVEAVIKAGKNPDGIAFANGKLYVSNSGGLDFNSPDSTISVIRISDFTEIKKISVRANPGTIHADDEGNMYVVSRGVFNYDKMDYDCRLHRIDTYFDQVSATLDVQVVNFSICGHTAYMYGYGENRTKIMVLDTRSGEIINWNFIQDATEIERPYGIVADPLNGDIFICDAKNYVTPGSVLCFGGDGLVKYSVNNVGINPNGIIIHSLSTSAGSTGQNSISGSISTVFDYSPAPGQFVNLIPSYVQGDSENDMNRKCLEMLKKGSTITLGGYGGYIITGFDSPVRNIPEEFDFQINGNAFAGSSEPGVVMISADVNSNGIPDDEWYEIGGSEHLKGNVIQNYQITYYRAASSNENIIWRDNTGKDGVINHNAQYHSQSYYPLWKTTDSLTFSGSLLPNNVIYQDKTWIGSSYEWGYADNEPNWSNGSKFKIEWAIDQDNNPVTLDSINFIRIITGVNFQAPGIGEISTEISSIFNLNPNN